MTFNFSAVLLTILAFGCSTTSRFTTRGDASAPIKPKDGQALVVFINAGKVASNVPIYLVDAKRRFLGESIGMSRVLVDLDPGQYTFYAVNKKDGSKVDANLDAGKTYFVRVRVGWGGGSLDLVAFTERSEEWVHREDWLQNRTTPVVTDFAAGQAFVDKYNWVGTNMTVADEKFSELAPDVQSNSYTLRSGDGI